MTDHEKTIPVDFVKDEKTNGLGMMIGQYLEQNLDEFDDKVRQARRLNIVTSVEVEKGIATTISFSPDRIVIQNGVSGNAHLHLKSSYMTLADVLSGKINPFKGVMSGEIKIEKIPMSKPLGALRLLRFLKIPEELLVEGRKPRLVLTRERAAAFFIGAGCGFGLAYLFVILGWF
ncbi:MAG: SCP2 sterol-binding domain-containing protein [Desulfobacterales bacterium]